MQTALLVKHRMRFVFFRKLKTFNSLVLFTCYSELLNVCFFYFVALQPVI